MVFFRNLRSKAYFRDQPGKNFPGYHMMPFRTGVHAVTGIPETGIPGLLSSNEFPKPGTDIYDFPAVFSFRNQPFRVLVQYSVVLSLFSGIPPEQWRSNEDNLRFCRIGSLFKADIPFLVRLKTRSVKRLHEAVIHPVAGQNQLRLVHLENPAEALMQAWTGESAARMAIFAQPGYRLAGNGKIDNLAGCKFFIVPQGVFHFIGPMARVSNTITQNGNPALIQRLGMKPHPRSRTTQHHQQ